MVVICFPFASAIVVTHERSALPLMCTVHAPHRDIPQPNFVPGRFNTSRITQSKGISAGTSTVTGLPLTVSLNAMADLLVPAFLSQQSDQTQACYCDSSF